LGVTANPSSEVPRAKLADLVRCKPCGKPFTEPIQGIRKGSRSTERYKRSVLWVCEAFSDIAAVHRTYACSAGFVYRTLYEQLELKRRERLYPWPKVLGKVLGMDEHFFRRSPAFGFREFVSVPVDSKGRRLMAVVKGKSSVELEHDLAPIPGRSNVQYVVTDMSDGYRTFAKGFSRNALVVADKFHVLRLLPPAINRHRRLVTGNRRTAVLRGLLLRNGPSLRAEYRFRLLRKTSTASTESAATTAPPRPSPAWRTRWPSPHCPRCTPSAAPSCAEDSRCSPTSPPASPTAWRRASTTRQRS